jgi:hypothetical protein
MVAIGSAWSTGPLWPAADALKSSKITAATSGIALVARIAGYVIKSRAFNAKV